MSKKNKKKYIYFLLFVHIAALLLVGHLYSKSHSEGYGIKDLDLSKAQEMDSRTVQRFAQRDPKELRFDHAGFALKRPLVVGRQSKFKIKFLTKKGEVAHLYPLAGKLIFILSDQAPKGSIITKGDSYPLHKRLVLSRKQLQYDKGVLHAKLNFARVKDSFKLTIKHRVPGQRKAQKILQTKLQVTYGPVRQLRFSPPTKSLQAGQTIRLQITAFNYRGDIIKKWLPSQVPLRLDSGGAKAEINYSIAATEGKPEKGKAQKRINLPGNHFSDGRVTLSLRATKTGRYHLGLLGRQSSTSHLKRRSQKKLSAKRRRNGESSFSLKVKPAAVAQTKIKCQDYYPAGQKISLAWIQTDKFGNIIPNPRLRFRITPDPGQALKLPSNQDSPPASKEEDESDSSRKGRSILLTQKAPIIVERAGTYTITTDKGSKKITITPLKLDHWQVAMPSQITAGNNTLLRIRALDRYNNLVDDKQKILLRVDKKGLLPQAQKPQRQPNNQSKNERSLQKSNQKNNNKFTSVNKKVVFTGTWKYMFQPQKAGRYKLLVEHRQTSTGDDFQKNITQKLIKVSPNKPTFAYFSLARQNVGAGQLLRFTPHLYDAYHNPVSAKKYDDIQTLITWNPPQGRSTKVQPRPTLQWNGNKITFSSKKGGYPVKLKARRTNRLRLFRSGRYHLKPKKFKILTRLAKSKKDSSHSPKAEGSPNSFQVIPARATKVVIQAPSEVTAGQKINVSIYTQDRFGNQTFWPHKLRLVGSKGIIKKEQQAFFLKSTLNSQSKSQKNNTNNKKTEKKREEKDYLPSHNISLRLTRSGRYRLTVYGFHAPKTKKLVVKPAKIQLSASKSRLINSVFWLPLRLQDRFGNPPQQKKPLSLTASCPKQKTLEVYGRGVYSRSESQGQISFKINFYRGQKNRRIGLYCYQGHNLTLKQNGNSLWQKDLTKIQIASPRALYLARQQSNKPRLSLQVVSNNQNNKRIKLKSDVPLTSEQKQLAALSLALTEHKKQESYIIRWQNEQKNNAGFIFYHKAWGRLDIQLWRHDNGRRQWRKIWRKISADSIREAGSDKDKYFPGDKEVYK